MAADMDFSTPCEIVEDSYSKDNLSDMDNENLDNVKRVPLGKPPRHLSVMRHSMGSAKLIAEANLELDIGIIVHKSSSDEKNEFLPVLRSGSCAEIGPKQYMEDEHICIDDLIGHLGTTAEFPSPGAFYGGAKCNLTPNIGAFVVLLPLLVLRRFSNGVWSASHSEKGNLEILCRPKGGGGGRRDIGTMLISFLCHPDSSVYRMGMCPEWMSVLLHVQLKGGLGIIVGLTPQLILANACGQVFDGHGGTDAALFIRKNILKFIVEDSHFPICVEKAIKSAFLKADYSFADASSLDISSGTTALIALIFGRTLIIANAGDCRAVLGRRGRAIEMSKDHKPNCTSERRRIEKLGGIIYDGYLNGQLSVARALGDWHMKGPKGSACPLSAEPELQETELSEEDEFLIMGCDGLWDVMSSQCAVTMARKELMVHNDPERCSRELVREALKRNTCDNLTVIVVCFSADPPPRIEIPQFRVRRSISAEGLNFLKGVLDSN
ncbi:hypothetical protein Goshw_029111 [Gossypium schwendimanii]|uniref:protein-serine/threonine phosphatase n=1 Tax=Gossypium schwendimanii TaxID=34291 RepID=A0A7J9LCQ7_GOSSC|nr:hypothetical protein [Gossypium schwendimanii]